MKTPALLGGLGLAVLLVGHGLGLLASPPEATMGETGRILYLHVPTAWTGMLALSVAFVAAIGALWSGGMRWDAVMEASVEVGVLFCAMLLFQGSIWSRPTIDAWWTWDPRLTTSAIMLVAFVGVLVLRRLVHQPGRRMVTSAVATIVAFVDVPVVYFSVEWWESAHQELSSMDTVDEVMLVPLLISLVGTTLLGAAFLVARAHIALARRRHEEAAPDLPPTPPPLDLEAAP